MQPPECPEALEYLLEWFVELSATRTSGGFAPNPITYQEILAWAQLMAIHPTPFEVATLIRLNNLYLAEYARSSGTGT